MSEVNRTDTRGGVSGQDPFAAIVSDFSFGDSSDSDVPDRCKDCPFVREQLGVLSQISTANEEGIRTVFRMQQPGTVLSDGLQNTAEAISETVANSPGEETCSIHGVEFSVPPGASAETIKSLFFAQIQNTIDNNDTMAKQVRESIATATGQCAGALVFGFVESPVGGAVATMTCDAPEGALMGDEDDDNIRPLSAPRRLSAKRWKKYQGQINLRRG